MASVSNKKAAVKTVQDKVSSVIYLMKLLMLADKAAKLSWSEVDNMITPMMQITIPIKASKIRPNLLIIFFIWKWFFDYIISEKKEYLFKLMRYILLGISWFKEQFIFWEWWGVGGKRHCLSVYIRGGESDN